MIEVRKHGASLVVSGEALAAAHEEAALLRRWLDATPEQREEWRREAGRRSAEVRAAAPKVELTVEALLGKMGWSREYATHLVQPYCECVDGMDGWEYCQHARDEGLTP